MLDDAEARTQRAMEAIAAYLASCPMAADTEEGIAQWWLPGMGVDVPQADVHEALERLLRDLRELGISDHRIQVFRPQGCANEDLVRAVTGTAAALN